jgi:hypothetical protein
LDGPLFKGTLEKVHFSPFFTQLLHIFVTVCNDELNSASHLIFFLLHASQALETFDRFRGAELFSLVFVISGPVSVATIVSDLSFGDLSPFSGDSLTPGIL